MEAAEVNMLSFSVTVTRVDGIRDKDVREDRGMLHVLLRLLLLRLELAGRRPRGRAKWRFMDAVKENKRSGD